MEQVVSSYQAISHRRETSCILSLPVYPITHEIVKISPTEFQNLHAGTHLVCLTPGAAVSWPASTTGCPGGRGSFRRVHRAAGGDRAAAVATGHRSVVRSGTPRPRVGPHSAQHAPAGAGAVRGCHLDESSAARGVAAA